jgi:uncharacterized protein (TIGR02147 family)
MNTQLPDIFQYIDFKKYLADYYTKRKSLDRGFTHAYICHRLGQLKSTSCFTNVLRGRMTLTPTFIDRFIDLLELKSDEAKFFRALVNYNQTISPQEKEFFFDQLVRLNRTPHKVIDENSYSYYKEWHHSVVRAVLDVIDFKDDYKALASILCPPITLKAARDSISLLKKLGLIVQDKNGYWRPSEKVLVTGDLIKDAVVKQFQMKCLDHAKNILANDNIAMNRNITMTISLSEKAHERISDRIRQFKSEVRSIIHKDEFPAQGVFHINLNFFPMSAKR